jgi:hypothetical protein
MENRPNVRVKTKKIEVVILAERNVTEKGKERN